jgi:hypothetical protein
MIPPSASAPSCRGPPGARPRRHALGSQSRAVPSSLPEARRPSGSAASTPVSSRRGPSRRAISAPRAGSQRRMVPSSPPEARWPSGSTANARTQGMANASTHSTPRQYLGESAPQPSDLGSAIPCVPLIAVALPRPHLIGLVRRLRPGPHGLMRRTLRQPLQQFAQKRVTSFDNLRIRR